MRIDNDKTTKAKQVYEEALALEVLDPFQAIAFLYQAICLNYLPAVNRLYNLNAEHENELTKQNRLDYEVDSAKLNSEQKFYRGLQYYLGINEARKRNNCLAFKYLEPLAKEGHAFAQFLLGMLYLIGQGIETNLGEAFYWFQESANQKNAHAENALADMYFYAVFVPLDYEKAFIWRLKAAEQELFVAQVNFRPTYETARCTITTLAGILIIRDLQRIERALFCIEKAFRNEDPAAQAEVRTSFILYQYKEIKRKQEFFLLEKAGENGNPEIQMQVAMMYLEENGVTQDFQKAFQWIKKAAEQEYSIAQYTMGFAYSFGVRIYSTKHGDCT